MCNTSDWIHCNKNPTLHRHPQNRNQSRGCLSKLAEKEPDLNFQLLLENKEKTKVSSSPPAPSFGSPGLPSVFLKLGTRKTVVDRKTKNPPFSTFSPSSSAPTPFLFFSRLKLSPAGVKPPIQGPTGCFNGEICVNQNQWETYMLQRSTFPPGLGWSWRDSP